MKVYAIVVAAAVAVKADTPAFCADGDVLTASSNAGDVVLCGSNSNTNCGNWAKDAFCAPWSDANGDLYSVCCDNSSGDSDAAAAINEFTTCGDCLDSDNNDNDDTNVWDGENCYAFGTAALNGIKYWLDPSVFSTQVFVTSQDSCPENCQRLEFSGTCWKRCGARGWGIDASLYTGVYGNAYSAAYSNMGFNNFGLGYGYGMQSPFLGYGMQSPYLGYGYGGVYGGVYGGMYGINYGAVPSVSGTPCPDPKTIEEIQSIELPILPPMFGLMGMGQLGLGYGYPFGRQFANGAYGFPAASVYGTSAMGYGMPMNYGYGSSFGMPMNYGLPSYSAPVSYSAPIASSVYTSTAAPVASVYGPASVYAPAASVYSPAASVYSAPVAEKARCDPVFQCSCDTKCCARGDCCADFDEEGCNVQY